MGAIKMVQAQPQRVVVKIGSSTLTTADGRIDEAYIKDMAKQISDLRAEGTQVILVSSGAIAVGLSELGITGPRPTDIPTLQAAASIGQIGLVRIYSQAFEPYATSVGQILLTRHDTAIRDAYLHARNTMERLLEFGAVPIINENDTIATDEIRFGDNDTLAALVATLIGADMVILLTDIEGFYSADPRKDEDAALLEHVGSFSEELVAAAGGVGSVRGSGGMLTKVEAARVLMAAGIPTVICEGRRENCVLSAVRGENIGTRFESDENAHRVNARKLWIALGGAPKGTVVVDDGAARALSIKGSSLLPVGVKSIEGNFVQNDAVNIRDQHGTLLGRGLARYSSDELALAAGKKSEELAANRLLAYLADTVFIHRDELLVF